MFKFTFIILLATVVSPAHIESPLAESSSKFSNSLYNQLVIDGENQENVVFSPASIQTCLALAFFGAAGQTAQEMSEGLHFQTSDKQSIAKRFSDVFINSKNSLELQIANKIYVKDGVHIKNDFNTVAKESFQSEAEAIDFKDSNSVEKINSWVAEKTNKNIKHLIDSIEDDTYMILVNAIHLKAKWKKPFNNAKTHKADFYTTPSTTVQVDMMKNTNVYIPNALFPELDASGIEMKYKDSDLSMVIILPSKKDGLYDLEKKLQNVNLHDLTSEMKQTGVNVFLPKFTIESEFDLKGPLEKMGMPTMFSNSANFNDLLEDGPELKVSKVIHKAFIKVDEDGTEASAATYTSVTKLTGLGASRVFIADHPFFYFIKDANNIYFMGHVTKF